METYPYIFKSMKTVQAMGVLLKSKESHRHNYYEVVETLYKADLKSIKETRYPIMRIKVWMPSSNNVSWKGFIQFVQPVENKPTTELELELIEDPGYGELSPYEMELLHDTFKEVSNE